MAQENTARVITIAATEQPQDIRLRVAAYARVSSSSDEQLNSFAAQNRYYTELISSKDNWQLVDIYADEGITGTSIEKRDDFKRMLRDCERGLIDRILVKSISRFARNTTECLETVRSLKARGISVYFEKEGIDTGKVSGEMLTAVFASLAQAESESISKNVKWGIGKRMRDGTFNTCCAPVGFHLENGKLAVVEEARHVIAKIYEDYLNGLNSREIAAALNRENMLDRRWSRELVDYILTNERYAGNALLQKRYTTATLPKTAPRNHGEREMFFVTGSNPAIITEETFNRAKSLRAQRKVSQAATDRPLSKKVRCICGSRCRRKSNAGTWKWVCVVHDEGGKCPNKAIPELEIYGAFQRLYFKLKSNPDILSQALRGLIEIRNRRMLWSIDVIEINKKISDVLSQNQMLAVLKQQGLVDPDIFISKTNELTKQLRELKLQKERLLKAEGSNAEQLTRVLIATIAESPDFLDGFDAELFGELIDQVIIKDDFHVIFRLRNGLELQETIERTFRR